MRIAIVGVGMHPFGRTPERNGMQQGSTPREKRWPMPAWSWKDMQFGYGGSYSAG